MASDKDDLLLKPPMSLGLLIRPLSAIATDSPSQSQALVPAARIPHFSLRLPVNNRLKSSEPKESSAATEKLATKDEATQAPLQNTPNSSLETLQCAVTCAWLHVLSSVNIFKGFVFVFQAPLRSLGAILWRLIIVMAFIMIAGWAVCRNSWISMFSICHANANSPLCTTIPFAYNIWMWCPGPTLVSTSEFTDPTEQYMRVLDVSEEQLNLPYALVEYRTRMSNHYADILTSKIRNATELSTKIDSYTRTLQPATNDFIELTYNIFLLSAHIYHGLLTLYAEMSKLESRTLLQRTITDPICATFGISTEPSVSAYLNLWLEFTSEFEVPAQKVYSKAINLAKIFEHLGEDMKYIQILATQSTKDTNREYSSLNMFARLFRTQAVSEAQESIQSLKDLRDACTQSFVTIDRIRIGMQRLRDTSKSLGEMRNRKIRGVPNLRTQIGLVKELVDQLKNFREEAHRKRLQEVGWIL